MGRRGLRHSLRPDSGDVDHWRPHHQFTMDQGGFVFAVLGTWIRDDAMRARQDQALPNLVNGVRQNPGFVRGFWADDVDQSERSVTFIVFDTMDQARAFRDAVLPAQARSRQDTAGGDALPQAPKLRSDLNRTGARRHWAGEYRAGCSV
jgi:hypothetical protein